jgi:ABC-type branched-subunit amino acid transport system substrate-binding protein
VATDKTVNLTNVPWMFSIAPNDHQVAEVLAEGLARTAPGRRRTLITTNDHDAFLLTREVRRALTTRQIVLSQQYEYQPQSESVDQLVRQCLAGKPDELLIIANAQDSVQLVRAVRQAGFAGRICGGPACGRAPFVQAVADAAGDLVFPRLNDGASTAAAPGDAAQVTSRDAHAAESDYAALQMYDAVNIVIAAIEKAGLSRVEIAHAIRTLSPISGASGRIEWDAPGSNTRRPTLATIVDGRVVPLPPGPLAPPVPQ